MTPSRRITLGTVLCAALAVSGCSTESAGSPMPGDTVTNTSEPDTSETTSSSDPTGGRPRELTLDGKDPCALIQQANWPKFHIEEPGEALAPDESSFDSPSCYYPSDYAGLVTLVVTAGVEEKMSEDILNAEIEDVEPIEGFPTITVASGVDDRTCMAAVDVADGQFLLTTARPNPNDPQQPERCDLAYQLAESAMTTLVAS